MKPFALDPKMLTMAGVFYPTGHIMAMVPDHNCAMQVARDIEAVPEHGDVSLLEPAAVIHEIGPTARGSDDGALPSAGTEAATVRQFVDLAQQGQYGLLIRVANDEQAARVMDVLHANKFSYAQRYHMLAIEDIV